MMVVCSEELLRLTALMKGMPCERNRQLAGECCGRFERLETIRALVAGLSHEELILARSQAFRRWRLAAPQSSAKEGGR